MGATDVTPTRLDAAKAAAIDALKDLPAGGKVSVIAAGRTARVVANGTTDLGNVKQAIAAIPPSYDVGDLGDALRLASALAARSGDAEILVATDAAVATPPKATVDAPIRVLQVGRDARNEAIVALAVRTAPSGLSHSAFVSVANLGLEQAERRIQLYADGVLRDSRVLTLDPQRKSDVVIDDVDDPDHPASVIEVRLVAKDETATGAPDPLAIDDRAWAIVPPQQSRNILLVGEGDPYLETALSYLPDTNLFGVKTDRYPQDAARTDGTDWDLIIFEGFVPAALPSTPILAIAPPRTSPLGTVTGTLTNPGIGSLDLTDPILRYVDLSTVHVGQAQKLELPAWARAVIPGPGTSPLLYSGSLAGRPAAVLAFEPRRSDLPLQVAFPVLLANLAGELLGGSQTPADAIAPGQPGHAPDPRRREGRPRRAAGRERRRAARADGQRRRASRSPARTSSACTPSRPSPIPTRPPPPRVERRPVGHGDAAAPRPVLPPARPVPRPRSGPPIPGRRSSSRSTCSTSASRRSLRATPRRSRGLGSGGRGPGHGRPTPPCGRTRATRSGSRSCCWRCWS